ncbi:cation:proton antiporter domain-containing protein [Marinoscillum furvescens]|uniref:Transporter (CPA2 family) n=1 Tax=Marinoscillum furvescens DSM 4134 TaxID=1122208 RepID=A0A3D9KWG3_MARFU|nr:cation:proton antiporter [Marinoscillum furvescens]RED92473.1 transporter (CPA2 family) [Marinoscillum furvescens DSM 4134]
MDTINYWPLFIIFIIAWIVPLVLSWLEVSKVPAVIVEIIMGVIMGPFVFDLIPDTPYMDFLAKTGFLFLIFLAGLEIDVSKMLSSLPRGKIRMVDVVSNSLLVALIIYFGSLFLSLPFAWLVAQFIEIDVVFLTILLPTVALSITVPILKAEGELSRKFGQIMLMEGAIATIMSIILISVYSGVLKNGFQVELLLFTVIFAVFVVTYIVGKRMMRVRTFQHLLYRLEHAASQIRVRGTVALLLLFVIVAHWINTELVMGAFFAGTLMALFVNKERSALLFKLDGMSYGFFIPIFFIMVGVKLDLSSLAQFQDSIPLILTLIVGFSVTQILPALILSRVFGIKRAFAGGVLLCARMGLTIAAAQIGLSLEVISPADNASIVTAAILISLISPLIYKIFSSEGEAHYGIYIFGGNRSSLLLAERIKMHGISCLTVLQNKDIIPEFERKSIKFKAVDHLSTETLDKLDIRTGDMVIVLTENRALNQELTRHLKEELNHHKVITKKQSMTHDIINADSNLKFVDIDEITAKYVEDMIVRPDSVTALAESFGMYRVEEIHIKRSDIHRKLVKEIAFPPTGSLVMQRRGSEIFIPHGDTHLLKGDVITVIGNTAALTQFRELLE